MPYCPRCGVDNPASARFCDQCGATLIPVAAQPAPTPTLVRPISAPTPPRTASAAPLSAGPINCAQCGASAIPGEAFCDNCGAPLQSPAPSVAAPAPPVSVAPQASFPPPQASFPPPQNSPAPPAYTQPVAPPSYTPPVVQPTAPPPAPIRTSLAPARLLLDGGVELGLPAAAQAVIGRADLVSNFVPEIDLGGHGAIDSGVGRRHARLFLQNGQVMLEDLNSTNGTTLNSQRLKPNHPQAVGDGDTILLGSMRMRFSQ